MKKLRVHKKWIALVFTIFLGATGAASVQAADNSNQDNWQFNLAPFYLWAVSIEGSSKASANLNTIDVELGDVFDLESVFIVHFEGMHKSNFGFLIDTNYLNIGGGQTFSTALLNVDFQATLAEFSGLYQIKKQNHKFDLIAGVRYFSLDAGLNLTGKPNLEINANQNWTDPIIGARWGWQFADNWKLSVRGDIGGFGVGSNFSWQAAGLVDWQPFEYVSFIAGYRALYEDYEDEDGLERFALDATFHGPVIGVNFKW